MPSKSTIYVSDFSNNRLEPIQYNLITVHTLRSSISLRKLTLRRLQYVLVDFNVGQWVDCRDTVNQWLEATILDASTMREVQDSLPEVLDS